jgi:predicted XRE-type DNA-binding protein
MKPTQIELNRSGKMSEGLTVQTGSGNVFADLGLPNSDELLIKAKLAHQISELISARNLTQVEAAELLGIDQPKVSALVRGKLSGFSTERLFRFLNALGNNVEIRIIAKSSSEAQAKTHVVLL